MRSSWLPIFVSFLVIVISVVIIRFPPQIKEVSISNPSAPVVSVTPTPRLDPDYASTYAKCGELPNLSDYSPLRFPGEYSAKMWSPSCRFIAWSATIKYSFGSWSASKYEGLFLYDLKTQKTSRLYVPTSESDFVVFKNWQDDTHFVFRRNDDASDYLYNLSSKSFAKL